MMTLPLLVEIDESGWSERCVFQHTQGRFDDGELPVGIVGQAERIAVTIRHEQRPWRSHSLRHRAQKVDGDRRDSPPFQLRRHQTHGLVTYRSHWDQ